MKRRPKEDQFNELAVVARLQRCVWQLLLDAKEQTMDANPPADFIKL